MLTGGGNMGIVREEFGVLMLENGWPTGKGVLNRWYEEVCRFRAGKCCVPCGING